MSLEAGKEKIENIKNMGKCRLEMAYEAQKKKLCSDEAKMKIVCGIISKISFAMSVVMFISFFYEISATVLLMFNKGTRWILWHRMFTGGLSRFFLPLNDLLQSRRFMHERSLLIILHIGLAVTSIMWGLTVFNFSRIFGSISDGQKPFSDHNIRRLSQATAYSGVTVLIQPIFIFPTLLILTVRYIFKYGGVLQQKADSTIHDQENIIFSFAEITENKSGQTGQHIRRVSEYSKILSEEMGLTPEKTDNIRLASVLHDVGKLLIDSSILEKPGKLTDEEFAEIKKHSAYGDKLLTGLNGDILSCARIIARDHHERWDGKGYNNGTSRDSISIEGRIVAVADVFDALTSRRSYKNAWTSEDAFNEITSKSGTQFDPEVVEAFKKAFGRIEEVRKTLAD